MEFQQGIPIPFSDINDDRMWEGTAGSLPATKRYMTDIKEIDMSEMKGKDWSGFTVLRMNVREGDDSTNVIFEGRWLVDGLTRPDPSQTDISRYAVALTPTDSFFVFHEHLSTPEVRRYDVYDDFVGMEESREVPQVILDAVSSALVPGPGKEDMEPDA